VIGLYDTAERKVVDVAPAGAALTMYTCGPTVYRYAHIGNLRTFLLADLIRRAFEYCGSVVDQVQNITDVGHMTDELFDRGEDRMLVQAGIEERSPEEIAAYYTEFFLRDAAAMNLRPARAYPRASEHIPLMVELVAKLLERGHAYEAGGNVYFDVRSFPSYGRLSQNTLTALKPGHRLDEVDPLKQHHADFLLWKAAGPSRLIRFAAPWSEGYPGWHIECSAMSLAYLGDRFDVHTGGMDLIFPHHEDEIAQSESAVGHRVVGHWVHGAHLLAEGRKMSKSSQNFFDLRDLEARGHSEPLAFRLLCLQTRYRAQMNFTWDALDAAERTLARWRRLVAAWPDGPAGAHSEAYEQRFRDALSADLDTPAVVALISDVIAAKDLTPGERGALLRRWDAVLALDLDREPREADIPPEAIELVERRQRAREDRDWATADRLRVELGALGVEVDDTPDGPKARRR
jgi:cysteinyl-tRNA synthetase